MTLPELVVVMTLVAVVSSVQPAQVVQGAFVPHGPLVHPLQVLPGQALPPHHAVQGPDVHAPSLVKPPQFPPKGPRGPA